MIKLKFSECGDKQRFHFVDKTGAPIETSLLIKSSAHITTDDRADTRTGYTYLKGDLTGDFFQVRTDFDVLVEYIRPTASERLAAKRKENLEKALDENINLNEQ